jgi:arylsulfatase A-like enzyme
MTEGKSYEFTMGTPHGYGIRTEKYRYTEWRKDKINTDFSMLYDLEKDPEEYTNLVDDPDYQIIVNEMRQKLDSAIVRDY